jgi:hypothetical protein
LLKKKNEKIIALLVGLALSCSNSKTEKTTFSKEALRLY